MELYGLVLKDSFLAALLFPPNSEVALPAMQSFGGFSPLWMGLAAFAGAMAGATANWAVGRWIVSSLKPSGRFSKSQMFIKTYGHYALLFAWLPLFGPVLTLAAGLLRFPLRLFLLFTALGKAGYYVYLMSFLQW